MDLSLLGKKKIMVEILALDIHLGVARSTSGLAQRLAVMGAQGQQAEC